MTGAAGKRTIGGANSGRDSRARSGQNIVEGTAARVMLTGAALCLPAQRYADRCGLMLTG